MSTEELLVALIRAGLGNGCDFEIPDDADWKALSDLADRKGLSAIACDGLQALYASRPAGFRTSIDNEENKAVRRLWYASAFNYERAYKKYREALMTVLSSFSEAGMKMLLLKGYGLSLNYPVPEHRPVGDMDIYSGKDFDRANAFVEAKGVKVNMEHHKHSVFKACGYDVENHYCFLNVHGHKSTAKVEAHLQSLVGGSVDCGSYLLPSDDFNALYLLRHMGEHFASTGINLRHVIDWGTFVTAHSAGINWNWFLTMVEDLGMTDFLACVDGICVSRLGMDGSKFPELEYDEALMQRILDESFNREFKEKKPSGLFKIIAFKFRRWKANGWKQDLVFSDSRLSSFLNQVWSHVLKPASIK